MKTISSTFLLVLFSWHSCFANMANNNPLPFKVKSKKVNIEFHSRDRMQAYLIDVNMEYVYVVMNKNDIEKAILSDCKNCKRLKVIQIRNMKSKKSAWGTILGFATLILTFGIVLSSQDNTSGDSPSERFKLGITIMPLVGLIGAIIYFNALQPEKLNSIVRLKKKSSLYDYGIKKTESLRSFYKDPIHKQYTFFMNNFTRTVKGYYLSTDDDYIILKPEYKSSKDEVFKIPRAEIDYIK